jgi:hypothetical protein
VASALIWHSHSYDLQGISTASIIAHSYGTLVASALIKRHPSLVTPQHGGLTLIDPVCFAMFLPHLVRKTLHFEAKHVPAPAVMCPELKNGGNGNSDVWAMRGLKMWLSVKDLMKGTEDIEVVEVRLML